MGKPWVGIVLLGMLVLATGCSTPESSTESAPTVTVTKTVEVHPPKMSIFDTQQYKVGWRNGARFMCSSLYGGPGPFGKWRVETDPQGYFIAARKALVWLTVEPDGQPVEEVTYGRCVDMAKSGPPNA